MSYNSFLQISSSIVHSIIDSVVRNADVNDDNKKKSIYVDCACLPLGKNQDFCKYGEGITQFSNEHFYYIVVCDGHGVDNNGNCICIDYLRTLDWDFYMSTYHSSVVNMINIDMYDKCPETFDAYHCGTTLTLARIYKNRCELWNVGDSQSIVFIHNDICYMNPCHTYENQDEQKRLKGMINDVVCMWKPTVVDDKSIVLEKSYGVCFNHPKQKGEYVCIVPTMCIGHGGITGFSPDYKVILFDGETQHVRIVLFSDGFGDMNLLSRKEDLDDLQKMTALELANKAEKRWRQTWRVLKNRDDLSSYDLNSFPPDDYDDISVAVWDNGVII